MTLIPSRHNIFAPVEQQDSFIILNLLSGQADIISAREKAVIEACLQPDISAEYALKGYWVDAGQEEALFKIKYLEFLEKREQEEIQVFFVAGYGCNFNCSYCYQSEYPISNQDFNPEVVQSFFRFISREFSHRKKYITLFGGEPLLANDAHHDFILFFLEKARDNNLQVSIVTNGYHLGAYLPHLDAELIREIQITLDGTREVHDKRRKLKDGKPTFDRIVSQLEACLQKNIPVNLRVVIDKENMSDLPNLASYAIKRGWTSNPFFKTQLGRNYELHYCQQGSDRLFDRLEMYQSLYHLLITYPHLKEFHQPAFGPTRFLFENGHLPDPLFDACPGCKSEWAMDYSGAIYSCTATVGKPEEQLGTFYPHIQLDEKKIHEWQQRDVLAIEECRNCNVQLFCGAGCASLAHNVHHKLHACDCRPIDKLTGLGAGWYFGR